MTDINPKATFDALFLVHRASDVDGLFSTEIQVFAYLACLLSLFDGVPASGWGYGFVAVPPLQPFSPDLESATKALGLRGFLVPEGMGWRVSESGQTEIALWQDLSMFRPRRRWLEPAIGATALHSVASITDRLASEPSLAAASDLGSTRDLLETAGLTTLYEQFSALRTAVGAAASELLIPADVYLRYLARMRDERQHNPEAATVT